MHYIVAIIGRPNVGKSTLFNRLVQARKAIVDNESGVTRDRQYGDVEWNGKTFQVIDTGGYLADSDNVFEKEIIKQIHLAVEEAHALIFMVDVKDGLTYLDEAATELLHNTNKPVYLAVNKVDNNKNMLEAQEFYSMGFEKIFFISSISGSGIGDLLDDLVLEINTLIPDEINSEIPKIAIIGQPNVGKSSLLNTFLGEERTIVSKIAGTTRDSIFTHFNKFDKELILIDTAGIRKKTSSKEDLEFYSIIRAIKAIEEADVCILMIDAVMGMNAQDVNLFSMVTRKNKGILIVVNKWDLVEKNTQSVIEYTEKIKKKIAPFVDVPIVFTSVKEKQRLLKILDQVIEIFKNRKNRIQTSVLNDKLLKIIESYSAPVVRGHSVKIKYIVQLPTAIPSFAFYTNFPNDIKQPYRNYIENQMRKLFNFCGVPIRIFFRKK
ncbi:MAG: ribosome biogenesis GTPase Der [Alphaproteobacteria bacterium]|nr:ribosome biogenesis GTPase Der [Alphaproteobacteria bacterium]